MENDWEKVKAEFARRRAIVSLAGQAMGPNTTGTLAAALGVSEPRLIWSLRDGVVEGSRNKLGDDHPRSEVIASALEMMKPMERVEAARRLRKLANEIDEGPTGVEIFDDLPW